MSTFPRAHFKDPLLTDRSRLRLAMWRSTMLNPWVVAIVLALAIGAWLALTPAFAAVVVVAAMLMAWFDADRLTKWDWWTRLLAQLGLKQDEHRIDGLTPLLRSGDERRVLRSANDGRRRLLVFRSSDAPRLAGREDAQSHHDYTCVVYRDATPAIRFLSAHEHRAGSATWLGDRMRGPALGDVGTFTVESIDLHQRFELRSSQTDGALARKIFSPSFIVWFARQGVSFEYEGGDLVVLVDRVLEHAEEYKLLLARADEIHAAISRGANVIGELRALARSPNAARWPAGRPTVRGSRRRG